MRLVGDWPEQAEVITETCPNCKAIIDVPEKLREEAKLFNNSVNASLKRKGICKHSGHTCNKIELWKLAEEEDPFCPHVCCRLCNTKMCGVRCNGAAVEQRDPNLDIPKVPVYHMSLSHVWEECPNCKGQNRLSVQKTAFNGEFYTEYLEKCPDCGQALKWDWDEIDKKAKKTTDIKACEFAGLSGPVSQEELEKARALYAKRKN